MTDVVLRDVTEDDLPVFFEHQCDPDAVRMAAFASRDRTDRDAFDAQWSRTLCDETITKKAIVVDGHVAGYVASFERFGLPEVSYWLGREYWGRGIATKALGALLDDLDQLGMRPLYARAAKDNVASLRVLEKCGFTVVRHEKAFATSRGEEIEEVVLRLG